MLTVSFVALSSFVLNVQHIRLLYKKGMYPTIAGKIANSGPYDSVKDIYRKVQLSSSEKATVQKYEKVLTATPATGMDVMRGRDPYRDSFNESPQVGAAPLKN